MLIFLKGMCFLRVKEYLHELTKFEKILWLCSAIVVIISYVFARQGILSLVTSLIGVTALIFVAKGMVAGQILTIVFAIFYGVVSLKLNYYGEMLTYLFMTAPMAAFSAIQWLRHPYKNTNVVEISKLSKKNITLMLLLSALVTLVFYFVLQAFNTANLFWSTISVTTSFIAVYLTALRSPFYALGYAANDIVLIILWVLATISDISYLPMIACFLMFLINDIYGFVNWQKMQKEQR